MTTPSLFSFSALNSTENPKEPTQELLFECWLVKNQQDVERLLSYLRESLKKMKPEEFRCFHDNYLENFISHSEPEQQFELSILLAKWYIHETKDQFEELSKNYLQAMHYLAKALQIGSVYKSCCIKKVHQNCSKILIEIAKFHLIKEKNFEKALENFKVASPEDLEALNLFKKLNKQIDVLKTLLCEEEDKELIENLYTQVSYSFNFTGSSKEKLEKYRYLGEEIKYQRANSFSISSEYMTEKYWKGEEAFRQTFASLKLSEKLTVESLREFQRSATQAFQHFFSLFIEDAFAILGPPPTYFSLDKCSSLLSPSCPYDIRAMGSIGREEVCPYSDLEFMVLIGSEQKEAKEYFRRFVQILEIQIASLGKTPFEKPIFTCIHKKNPSGLHIDHSPSKDEKLIQTPLEMAKLQNNPIDAPQNIEYTVLKTTSLAQSDPSLFKDYQIALGKELSKKNREIRALQFFQTRQSDYQKNWPFPFRSDQEIIHIKKQYVEVLNHLLSDIAFFLGIQETNTLDIIDELVRKKIFTKQSGKLLKESVAAIYQIRIRLHLYYQTQKEEASCKPSLEFLTLSRQEIFLLEKCYWLVLKPLYQELEKVDSAENFFLVFKNFNLLEKSVVTVTPSLIGHLACHLYQENAPLRVHFHFCDILYQKDREFLSIYLRNIIDEELVNELENHYQPQKSNSSLRESVLQKKLSSIRVENQETSSDIESDEIFRWNFKNTKAQEAFAISRAKQEFEQMSKKPKAIIFHNFPTSKDRLEGFLHEDLEILELNKCLELTNDALKLIAEKSPRLKKLSLQGCKGVKKISGLDFQKLEKININNTEIQFFHINAPHLNCHSLNSENFPSIVFNITKNRCSLEKAHPCLKKDKEFVLAAIKMEEDRRIVKHADPSLKKDKKVILAALEKDRYILKHMLKYADESLKKDREFMSFIVLKYAEAFLDIDQSFQEEKEFLLTTVPKNPALLPFVQERFRKDEEIIRATIRKNPYIFQFIDETLKRDKKFIFSLLKEGYAIVEYLDEDLKKDKEFFLHIVSKYGLALQYADESLKKDKDIVIAAIKRNYRALQYADESLKKDKDIVIAAIERNYRALQYADESLKKDKDIVIAAILQGDERLLSDIGTVIAAILRGDKNLPLTWGEDKEVVLAVVSKKGRLLFFASDELKKDKEVVLAAIKQDVYAINYADKDLLKDKDIRLILHEHFSLKLYADEIAANHPNL